MPSFRMSLSLSSELADFSPEQKDAFYWPDEAAVLAGPGSGKTRVLVAKAAYLLQTTVEEPQAIACMTYTRAAAGEISDRLRRLFPRSRGRAWTGTVHGFCLNTILVPLGHLAGLPRLADGVLREDEQVSILQHSFDQTGMTDQATGRFLSFTGTRVRRRIATGEGPEEGDDPRWYVALKFYEDELRNRGLLDFEGITIRALELLEANPRLARLVASRYPWVLIDEYQDLGGVLHSIVKVLRSSGVKIIGVGDPNQCVMGFTGADPKYFFELRSLPGVEPFDLPDNFRSSEVVARASDRILGINEDTPRRARATADGEYVQLTVVAGGFNRHADQAAKAALELRARGVALSEIAVLYKQQVLYPGGGQKIEVKNGVTRALTELGLDFVAEQGTVWPNSRLTDFTRECATLALDRSAALTSEIRLRDLAYQYVRLLQLQSADAVGDVQPRIHNALLKSVAPGNSVRGFVKDLFGSLKLRMERFHRSEDSEAFTFLCGPNVGDSTLSELVGRSLGLEKITVATYQGSKGREWDYVILPYVVEGHIPSWYRGSARPSELPEQRRMLHVAISRPKSGVIVLTTQKQAAGAPYRIGGRSRFLAAFE